MCANILSHDAMRGETLHLEFVASLGGASGKVPRGFPRIIQSVGSEKLGWCAPEYVFDSLRFNLNLLL